MTLTFVGMVVGRMRVRAARGVIMLVPSMITVDVRRSLLRHRLGRP